MLKKTLLLFFLLFISSQTVFSWIDIQSLSSGNKIIKEIKQIKFDEFPDSTNPSLIQNGQGFLMTFRYSPDRDNQPWISYIGIVQLDTFFNPVSSPYLLNTRGVNSKTPSQAEDARLFSYRNRLFIIYNDNLEDIYPSYWDRRDMFIAELNWLEDRYELSKPLKLFFEAEYSKQLWQKNWTPFEYQGKLLLCYAIDPHLVLYLNLMTGDCYHFYDSFRQLNWDFGKLRGSSQAILVDGEYFSFFHSGIYDNSHITPNYYRWHYFMGAYTFSANSPFQITSMTSKPILTEGLYTASDREKRVVFPGGFAVVDSSIYVAYGKDDYEMWIMIIDKDELKKVLKPIEK